MLFQFIGRITIKKIVYPITIFICAQGCGPAGSSAFTIEYKKVFDSIPSASGIAINEDTVLIVCDDGTCIYKVSLNGFRQNKIAIKGMPFVQYREAKEVKHDFESACLLNWQGQNYLLAFGSGSNAKSRDSLLLFNISNSKDQTIISLNLFYKRLQTVTGTNSTQWNIEGVTKVDKDLILANRGNNMLIRFDANLFLSWLMGTNKDFPKVEYEVITLPAIQKHEARLSGLCTIDKDRLLFCASVEDTPDWTKDGPVLGSYFGIYSLKNKQLERTVLLKDSVGNPLKEKIESVEIVDKTIKDGLHFLAVGDNDNGSSNLFRISLQ